MLSLCDSNQSTRVNTGAPAAWLAAASYTTWFASKAIGDDDSLGVEAGAAGASAP
jgi:hypothetical protein